MTKTYSTKVAHGELKQGFRWYLAQCKPNAENVAFKNIKNQGFNAFLPFRKLTKRKAQTFQNPSCPLFPGYVFVALDTESGDWQKISNTRGVVRLVRFGQYPSPVPTIVMQSLFASCNDDNTFYPREVLKPGDEIQVIRGPLTGFSAKISDTNPHKRVYLLLEIMGQKSTIGLPEDHVLKVS